MSEWLDQASKWHEMYCYDLEVMSLNPGWVELGVLGTSVLSHTWTKNILTHSAKEIFDCDCKLWARAETPTDQ